MDGRRNGEDGVFPMMEVEYPPEEKVREQKAAILAAAPVRGTMGDRIREIYWEPGLHVIFYQSGCAWMVTGMVYALMLLGCILTRGDAGAGVFFPLMAAPMLYLVFSLVYMWSEEQEAVVELKGTLRYSFNRMVDLRMFYSSIVMTGLDLLLLPVMGGRSLREAWAAGAAGVSSSFLFALLSLYLYHKIGGWGHAGVMALAWAVLCAGVVRYGEMLYPFLFEDMPVAVHFAAAVCCLVCFMDYIRRMERNAYA